ncbi:MAG: hypothetical protein M1421_00640 [Candidatus Eremiobacteraeota bacterium]|nr:hypothetical protein [Candidatus Eremiobacteraeota bacterium]
MRTKKLEQLFFFFLFFFFLLGRNSWSAFEIYVFDKPYTGGIFLIHGHLYVEAKALAKEMHLTLSQRNGVLLIGEKPDHFIPGMVVINGKPFLQAVVIHKEIYVFLESFVKKTGNKMILNQATGIITILPGSSPFSQTRVQKIAKSFASLNPSSGGSGSSIGSSGAFEMNLPKQFPYLSLDLKHRSFNKNAEKFLIDRANAIYYIMIISNWGTLGEARMSQLLTDSLENFQSALSFQTFQPEDENPKSLISDEIHSLVQLMGKWRNRFAKIIPPPEFRDSYQFSLKGLDDLTALESQTLPQILRKPGRVNSGISPFAAELTQDEENYWDAYVADVKKLPRTSQVHGVNPLILNYFQRLEKWEDRYLFSPDFSIEILQNIGNPDLVNHPSMYLKGLNRLASFYSKAQSGFSRISPPKSFQKSNTILLRLSAHFGSLASDIQQLKQLAFSSGGFSGGNKLEQEQFSDYLAQLKTNDFIMAAQSNAMQRDAALYLTVLKTELK